jgi:hypothetical protein
VEFRDIKTEEYFKDDFVREVIDRSVWGHDLVDCLAGQTICTVVIVDVSITERNELRLM